MTGNRARNRRRQGLRRRINDPESMTSSSVEELLHKKKGGGVTKRKKTKKVVSYIHVGESGQSDLDNYLEGDQRLQLELFCEEDLPDMDLSDVINGLDQIGTSVDFCDDNHRCSRACPVGCQGHLRPNEVIIYEAEEEDGRLRRRKRFKGRFILRESANIMRERKKRKLQKSKEKWEVQRISEENFIVGEDMPVEYLRIMEGEPVSQEVEKTHAWSPTDKSYNLTMKTSHHNTVRRQPVTQSTDGVRGKVGAHRGVFIYEIIWPVRMRGTHATVGVTNKDAPLHSTGYQSLIGSNRFSWGWDIGRKEAVYDGTGTNYPATVRNHYQWIVPENFFMIIDMDEGTVSFAVDGKWLGVAFSNLQGETLYPAVSTVWGHAEISIRFVGSSRIMYEVADQGQQRRA